MATLFQPGHVTAVILDEMYESKHSGWLAKVSGMWAERVVLAYDCAPYFLLWRGVGSWMVSLESGTKSGFLCSHTCAVAVDVESESRLIAFRRFDCCAAVEADDLQQTEAVLRSHHCALVVGEGWLGQIGWHSSDICGVTGDEGRGSHWMRRWTLHPGVYSVVMDEDRDLQKS